MVEEQQSEQPEQVPAPAQAPESASGNFKPNIYPIIYWAIGFGVIAGVVLTVVWWLSQFITIIWAPVFLAGAGWGAYRNYKKQKDEWIRSNGATPQKQSPLNEFKDAARDIVTASRDMLAEEAAEDAAAEEAALAEAEAAGEVPPEETQPPAQV